MSVATPAATVRVQKVAGQRRAREAAPMTASGRVI
jgi:hypothetical protein